MEALAATPRALFPRASPAALMATARRTPPARRRCADAAPVRASAAAAEPAGEEKPAAAPKKVLKKKPVYSMKKGQIVRVDKEKYLNSINPSSAKLKGHVACIFPAVGFRSNSSNERRLLSSHSSTSLEPSLPPRRLQPIRRVPPPFATSLSTVLCPSCAHSPPPSANRLPHRPPTSSTPSHAPPPPPPPPRPPPRCLLLRRHRSPRERCEAVAGPAALERARWPGQITAWERRAGSRGERCPAVDAASVGLLLEKQRADAGAAHTTTRSPCRLATASRLHRSWPPPQPPSPLSPPPGRTLHQRQAASLDHEECGASVTTFASEKDPGPLVPSDDNAEYSVTVTASAEQAKAGGSPEHLENIREAKRYLSVGHPPFYKGLDYIYEDRGEVLDIKIFETGEYALIAWVGIPTPPAWLPTYMLIKSDKLDYERI